MVTEKEEEEYSDEDYEEDEFDDGEEEKEAVVPAMATADTSEKEKAKEEEEEEESADEYDDEFDEDDFEVEANLTEGEGDSPHKAAAKGREPAVDSNGKRRVRFNPYDSCAGPLNVSVQLIPLEEKAHTGLFYTGDEISAFMDYAEDIEDYCKDMITEVLDDVLLNWVMDW